MDYLSSKKILITRPNHEITTHYLCEWSQEIVDLALTKNFDVHDLKGTKANDAISYLEKQKYDFVILNGHGNIEGTEIYGHDNEKLIDSKEGYKSLRNTLVYALSCCASKSLGKKCCDNGTRAFIGYQDVFIFYYDKNMASRPLKDEYAKRILKPANQVSIGIMKGNNVSEAVEKSKDLFKQELLKLQSSESLIGSENVAMALMWNMAMLAVSGDEKAQI